MSKMSYHEISINNFLEQRNKPPQYITLPEFEIHSPDTYTFDGCVKVCQNGGLALKLYFVDGQEKLLDETKTRWRVTVKDISGTEKTVEGMTSLDQPNNNNNDDDADDRNVVTLTNDLFKNYPNDLRIKWSVTVTSSDDKNKVTEIACAVDIHPPPVLVYEASPRTTASQTAEPESSGDDFYAVPALPRGVNIYNPNECYKMDACPRGICVVVVNYTFSCTDSNAVKLKNIEGFEKDKDSLKTTFEKLCFKVIIHENLSDEDILKEMQKVSKTNHGDFDCFVCCLLSHGGEGHVYGANGLKVDISDITSLFSAQNCDSLREKPKLFFIQACQGNTKQPGIEPPSDRLQSLVLEELDFCPKYADFLLGYATFNNYVAWCHTLYGGWYIQALTEALDQLAEKEQDINKILTCVNDAVSKNICVQKDKHGAKKDKIWMQTPAPQFTLRKNLIFFNHQHATESVEPQAVDQADNNVVN